MESLYRRGVKRFKFVDRTFNLKIDTSVRILEFFLEKNDPQLFVHFELIPDHLPQRLKAVIQRFPPGALQFEIGVQTFNPRVQTLISRKQDNDKTKQNLAWLRQASGVHIHADLILGLPGENMQSIADGFDELARLEPHEIQVGILKRLRGSPIVRHTDNYDMRFNPLPPYNVLSTSLIDFATMQRLSRFARYWDMIANSGRFTSTIKLITASDPFARFMALSDWLFATTGQTHKISLGRLFDLLHQALPELYSADQERVRLALWEDYQRTGLKKRPSFASGESTVNPKPVAHTSTPQRQARHWRV
jgi:hypothetical protein